MTINIRQILSKAEVKEREEWCYQNIDADTDVRYVEANTSIPGETTCDVLWERWIMSDVYEFKFIKSEDAVLFKLTFGG